MTNPKIDLDGTKRWYNSNGKRHRDNDLPACEYPDGTKFWYKNGKRHRDNDLPACEYPDGSKFWYKNGKCHRDNDLPAVEYANGSKCWYKNGKRHRDNDLPAIEYSNGSQEYWINGKEVEAPINVAITKTLSNNTHQQKCEYCGSPAVIGLTINCSNENCYLFKR